MDNEDMLKCRKAVLDVLEKYNAEGFIAVGILASAMNEILAPRRDQAIVTLRPLLAYPESDDKI